MSKNPKIWWKLIKNSYNWQRKSSYLLNKLKYFNAIFRKVVNYDNIKSLKKPGFHPFFGRYFFEKKKKSEVKPHHIHFGVNKISFYLFRKFHYYISNQKATSSWSLFCLQVLKIRVAAAKNSILIERFLLLKANISQKRFFHIQDILVSLLITLSEWNMSPYSFSSVLTTTLHIVFH